MSRLLGVSGAFAARRHRMTWGEVKRAWREAFFAEGEVEWSLPHSPQAVSPVCTLTELGRFLP